MIPGLVAAYFMLLAGLVVGLLAWFGALFTGAVPQFAWEYGTGLLDFATRLFAYGLLMTDRWPRIGFSEPDYPVLPVFAPPDRLNPVSVFFRLILAIPAAIVSGMLSLGGYLFAILLWVYALVTGGISPSLQGMAAAIVRYNLRYNAWFWMLTPTYPVRGAMGDDPGDASPLALRLDNGQRTGLGIVFAVGVILYIALIAINASASHPNQNNPLYNPNCPNGELVC
jgi:hypothetical protein